MSRSRPFAVLLLVVLPGCGRVPAPARAVQPVLTGATRVEVYRIDGGSTEAMPRAAGPGDAVVDGFVVLARGKDQGPVFAARLADVLLSGRTYTDRFVKCYAPGVAFRFYRGEERADAVVCFACGNLYLGPPSGGRVSENATFSGSPAAGRLVRLAKEALPDDKDIQALDEAGQEPPTGR